MDFEVLKDEASRIFYKMFLTNQDFTQIWAQKQFLTWRWWVAVSLVFVPLIIWLLVRKKDSTKRLLLVYFFVSSIASYLDIMGVNYYLWYYPVVVIPILPCLVPFNFSALPITTMLFIQYKPNIKPIFKYPY